MVTIPCKKNASTTIKVILTKKIDFFCDKRVLGILSSHYGLWDMGYLSKKCRDTGYSKHPHIRIRGLRTSG